MQKASDLAKHVKPLLNEAGLDSSKIDLERFCELMKDRATFISDMLEEYYFFKAPTEFDEKTQRKKWKENSGDLLRELALRFQAMSDFKSEAIETTFKAFVEEKELGLGAVLPLFRLTVTGKAMGPSMFDIADILGKEEVVSRINSGIEKLG